MTTEAMLRVIAETRDYYVAQAQPFGWNKERQVCCYLDERTGARCAIGRYIGDDVIEELLTPLDATDPDWQDMGIADFIQMDPNILPRVPLRFLKDLQAAHDDVAHAEGMYKSRPARNRAGRYDAREEMDQALDRLQAKVLAGDY